MGGLSVEKKLPNALDQITKKTSDQPRKLATDRAEKSFDEMIDFVIKCTLAAAKNIDPTSEDSGGSKSSEMLQTASTMAMVGSAKQQVAKMEEMLEAIKNPGYNALELQGKEISYDNSKEHFDGKASVKFKYNVNYLEENKGGTVTTTIRVKDKDGKVVYETNGNGQLGDHEFAWDGQDKKGKKMPAGTYSIEVSGTGSRMQGGKQVPFAVDATSTITAVVESVEVQNGVVKKLMLSNGKTIDKDQIIRIQATKLPKTAVTLSPELIGHQVQLDLSRAQVLSGNMDVYFNNHVKNPGKMTVQVYNDKGKLVKTLENNDVKKAGNKATFANTGLESGNYTVKVTVEDKDNSDALEKLSTDLTTMVVVGINYLNKTFMTIDEKQFSAHNIDSIMVEHDTPIQQRANKFIGATIQYNDSEFTFQPNSFAPEVFVAQSDVEGSIVLGEELRIYNETKDLVATLYAEYNPVEYLAMTPAQLAIPVRLPGISVPGRWVTYGDLANEKNKLEAYRFIEEELKADSYKFKNPDFAKDFKAGARKLKFPMWNGDFTVGAFIGQTAKAGQVFTTNRATIHLKADGSNFATDPLPMGLSVVESVEQDENGELSLHLQNGKIIREDQVIRKI